MKSRQEFKSKLVKFLEGEFVKLALKKLLGSSSMGGVRAWLISLLAKELYEEVGEPLVELALRKVGYAYNKFDGKVKVNKLKEARRAKDEDAYDDISTDILS